MLSRKQYPDTLTCSGRALAEVYGASRVTYDMSAGRNCPAHAFRDVFAWPDRQCVLGGVLTETFSCVCAGWLSYVNSHNSVNV